MQIPLIALIAHGSAPVSTLNNVDRDSTLKMSEWIFKTMNILLNRTEYLTPSVNRYWEQSTRIHNHILYGHDYKWECLETSRKPHRGVSNQCVPVKHCPAPGDWGAVVVTPGHLVIWYDDIWSVLTSSLSIVWEKENVLTELQGFPHDWGSVVVTPGTWSRGHLIWWYLMIWARDKLRRGHMEVNMMNYPNLFIKVWR